MEEVKLRHYDLSNGMARQMSPLLLGRLVETIPHTAVEVFGLEWFYGGGVQSLPSRQVVQVYGFEPVEVISLGRTDKTKEELLRFLQVWPASSLWQDLLREMFLLCCMIRLSF